MDFQIDILEEACETASHIVNCHRTAYMHAHAHVMAFMRFPNMAFPNSDIYGVSEFDFFFFFFFFFFFPRVSPMSFLKLRETRATRVFYTGEIIGGNLRTFWSLQTKTDNRAIYTALLATLEKSRHFGASCLATTHKHSRNIARKIPSRSAIFLKCREDSQCKW